MQAPYNVFIKIGVGRAILLGSLRWNDPITIRFRCRHIALLLSWLVRVCEMRGQLSDCCGLSANG